MQTLWSSVASTGVKSICWELLIMWFSIHFLHNKIMYPTSKIQISSPQFSNFDQTCLKKFAKFFSVDWKCVIRTVFAGCFLKKLWMPYFKMINAPWAVIIFLKALNPYWKQEASSSDQQYKCLEITKYSVFSKIHRDLSKFKHSVLCEMLTIT